MEIPEHMGNAENGLKQSSVSQSSPEPPLIPIPDHQLLRRIGHGSYGEVWLARNLMGGYRAVKIVSRHAFDHARPFERELAGIEKFEPISRSHQSFVDILHVGRNDAADCFYYVMELGDDQAAGQQIDPAAYRSKTLTSMLAERGRLTVAECLQIAINLAEGLQFLHEQGLSHRDIKPSNIIFVNGVPKLADIGLVTSIGEGQSYVGTEGYIPPEGPGTPQADIYSLGMVLYELSTGKDRRDFPALPEDFASYPDATSFSELNEVILRAGQGNVQQRYASAAAMLSDLMVLGNGRSVQRLRTRERQFRHAKKAALAGGAVLALLAMFAYPSLWRFTQARDQRERPMVTNSSSGMGALNPGPSMKALPAAEQDLAPTNMVLVPAGTFTMGDTLGDGDTEGLPTQTVKVSAFYMDKYEVTKQLWDGVHLWATNHEYSFDNPGSGKAANHPVQMINWFDMLKWCNARSEQEGRIPAYYTDAHQKTVYRSGQVNVQNDWVNWTTGYRLPTEAEWEKAARGGLSGRRFPWGDTITHSNANYCSDPSFLYDTSPTRGNHPSYNRGWMPCTSPVGSFAPNGYGLYDMAGNVWEWTWDWFAAYSTTAQTDPRGAFTGTYRVLRGGSWYSDHAASTRVTYRGRLDVPTNKYGHVGFRSILPPSQ
jgi:formylglycine-generating enzyme required for sulfatase activity